VQVPNIYSRKQEVTFLLILDQGFRNPTKPSSLVLFCFLGSIQFRYSKQIISVEFRNFKNTISEALYSLAVISPYKMSSHSSLHSRVSTATNSSILQRIASSGPKLHHQDSFFYFSVSALLFHKYEKIPTTFTSLPPMFMAFIMTTTAMSIATTPQTPPKNRGKKQDNMVGPQT
jgi:hypothetical protein